MIFSYKEPHIPERIEAVKDKIHRIIYAQGEYESQEDFELALRILLSREYKIPIFSDYFNNLTLDQLIFEVEVIKNLTMTQEQKTSEIINENKEEIASLFDDFEESDNEIQQNQEIGNMYKEFMNSGKFAGE